MSTAEKVKQVRLNGHWGEDDAVPFQSPSADKNLMKIVNELEKCEADHRKHNTQFKCEVHCVIYESCIACYDITCTQCRDRLLTNIEFVYCRRCLREIMRFSWEGNGNGK